jgi:bacteriocin-like protein
MSDERHPQPQDELSEDQLAEVSGGVGDPHQPVVTSGPSVEEKKNKPNDKQEYLEYKLEDVLISS